MKKRKLVAILVLLSFLTTPSMIMAQISGKQKYQSAKFVYMSSIGYSVGVGEFKVEGATVKNDVFTISITQLLAYQFNNYVFSGITAGVDIWKYTAFIPLTATVGVTFLDIEAKRVSPFLYLNGGYAFKWYMNTMPESGTKVIKGGNPGIHLEGGIGARFRMLPKLSAIFMLEYKAQQSTIQYSVIKEGEVDFSRFSTNRTEKVFYHFPGMKLSFLF